MRKEEKIQEAYGEYWCDEIDDDGWCRLSINSNKKLTDYMLKNRDLFESKVIKNPEWYETYFRPKSLQGIEDNNGWIKIESEADLPREIGRFFALIRDDIVICSCGDLHHYYKTGFATHYQPIIKPKPPVY